VRDAPALVRALAWAIRRLPAGRWRAMRRLPRVAAFRARLPADAGGYAFACDLRDHIARDVFVTGAYAPQETALLRAILRPGATFVDVGANWGYFTLLAAHLVGDTGRVLALEPDPRMHRLLATNVAENGLRQVTALAAAASDRTERRTLSGFDASGENWGVSSLVAAGEGPRFEVETRRMDDVTDELGVDAIDLLKMDIEGAEVMALRGMARGLAAGRYRRVLVELHPSLHPRGAALAADVAELFARAGYRGWTVDYAPETTRRLAYGRAADAASLLRPVDASDSTAWPHQLWAAPGVEPL
jgi:FkbM family methyltransferase